MQKVTKGFYVESWLIGNIGFWVLLLVNVFIISVSPKLAMVGGILVLIGFAILIFSIVVGMILLYKMWAAIEGPEARTSPGKAVGFLFIPFFNLYWFFQAYWGWAKDYNKTVKERQINAPLMSEGLALAIAILLVIGSIPYLGILVALPNIILLSVFFAKGINRINALADAGLEPQEIGYALPKEDAKTSGLAISSLILGILGFFTAGLTGIIGLILGIVGLNSIKKSGGQLKGDGLATAGIIVSSMSFIILTIALLLAILMPALAKTRQVAQRITCSSNLSGLGKAMLIYTSDDPCERYPTPSKWCDLLIAQADVSAKSFCCLSKSQGPCNYAINKYIEKPGTTAPPDMVLLFETNPGWNQFGGPDILSTDNHNGQGCNVLFNDGHVEFVKSENLDDLNWTLDKNDSKRLIMAAANAASLEFRIVPGLEGSDLLPTLSREELERYRKNLELNGPYEGRIRNDDFQWFEIWDSKRFGSLTDLPIHIYEGRTYLLLCAQPSYVMTSNAKDDWHWSLKKVKETTDAMGRRAVSFRFDEAGGNLFYNLTKENLNNKLAIVVKGKVVSSPVIRSAIRSEGIIEGNFTMSEIETIIHSLEKGMSSTSGW